MKLIDEKGRLFGKINLFDLLVVVVIFALIGGASYKFSVSNKNVAINESDLKVKLWVADIKDVTVNVINVGDIVKEYDSNLVFGEIIKKEVKPHYEEVKTSDGRVVNAPVEGKYDVYLTLKCRGIDSENAIAIASKEVRIGGKIVIKHKLYAVQSRAVEIIEQ
ncbi:DUF4330 domain-containing protein [Crassaminicella thermophila]|uniref:DUF4330 domain-containing protein n=1 Tax=Crassaminicella thermophila TaxID=2599308 RepID=A0A5C0SBI2_CRATE|nr:DUF4330 domain-containing protein [Crassaminicella thermophila]QEK11450.1 DUF4330 domain-containing protein [Crassaminicella thermophila]